MKTVIIGASPNPSRYAYLAAERLQSNNLEFIPIGIKKGEVFGQEILNIRTKPDIQDVHTITLYVGAHGLQGYEDYLIDLNPQRIIFNPGAENQLLDSMARSKGIETVFGCTLVMLASRTY